MDVGVMVPLVVADRRYDGFRLLRRCAVVEIGERFTVNPIARAPESPHGLISRQI